MRGRAPRPRQGAYPLYPISVDSRPPTCYHTCLYSWFPPVCCGVVPTTRTRLLLAGAVMALLELPAFAVIFFAIFLFFFWHLLAVLALLLLCPRLWVAVVALLAATGSTYYFYVLPGGVDAPWIALAHLVPVWAGTLIAYRPRFQRRG